jgi:hypothetical protein
VKRSLSEAQSRALYDRPYTEAHRNSYALKMERTKPPRPRELLHLLRKAYADEVPSRLHVHDTDAGGDPAWSPEFTRYLTGSDFATDTRDPGSVEVYTDPFRACMAGMQQSPHEGTRRRAAIVFRAVVAGEDLVTAAMCEGAPEWDAPACGARALELFWVRLSDIRLDLRRTETAA